MKSITVLIFGAEPVGLTVALSLARKGIPFILIEKRESTDSFPRTRWVSRRSMEMFYELGLLKMKGILSALPQGLHRKNLLFLKRLGLAAVRASKTSL